MNRSTAVALVLALVGILAVALVAATVPSTVTPDRPSSAGSGTGGTAGEGGGQGGADAALPAWLVALVDGLLAALRPVAALLLVALLAYALLHSRELVSGAASRLPALALALLLLLLVAALLSLVVASFPHLAGVFGRPGVPPSGGGGGTPATVDPATVLVALVAVVGVAALAWAALRRRSGADAGRDAAGAEEAAVGRAAGRAADDLSGSDSDVENAVYRAWREMTDSLGVEDDAARTPGEFARAAVEAGFDPEDVRELTRLFEDVRYGNVEATPALEERAVAVFRRIEADAETDRS